MRQTGDESDALESDGGCRHGLILEACDTCQLSIATAENERLKRDAEIYEGLNKQRHEVIDELFLVKAERDRYRTVLQGIADDTDADGFELRQAARRALTNTTPPPAAEPTFAHIASVADAMERDRAAAPPVALRPDSSTLGPAPRYFFILDDKPYETEGPSIPAVNIRARLPVGKIDYQLWLEVGPRNQCGNDRQLQDVDTISTEPPYPRVYSIPGAHK